MSEKVRIPFTFIVRKVTWRPADDPLPEAPQGSTITGLDGASLPIGVDLRHDPALDPLIEEARNEYFAGKAAEAKEARRRAWKAEEARWEPMPISPTTPPSAAKLYANMRRLKQPSASSGSENQIDAPEDPWDAWEQAVSAATAAARARDASTVERPSPAASARQIQDTSPGLLHDVSDDDPLKNPDTGQAVEPIGESPKLESPVEEQEKKDIELVPTGPGEERNLLPPLIGAVGDRGAKSTAERSGTEKQRSYDDLFGWLSEKAVTKVLRIGASESRTGKAIKIRRRWDTDGSTRVTKVMVFELIRVIPPRDLHLSERIT